MSSHPIHSRDADVCCRWLCESAGQRTKHDEDQIALALESLPFQGKPFPYQPDPTMMERVK